MTSLKKKYLYENNLLIWLEGTIKYTLHSIKSDTCCILSVLSKTSCARTNKLSLLIFLAATGIPTLNTLAE